MYLILSKQKLNKNVLVDISEPHFFQRMLACTFDPSLGGRSIDLTIAHHLAKAFNKPSSDVTKNKRSWIRLLAEVCGYLLFDMSTKLTIPSFF